MKRVGIIGGAGFIGSHITKQFLNHNYEVKVSTTDILDHAKYLHLMNLDHADSLHICELNVADHDALREFVSGCTILIHGGTPFQLAVKDAQTELFDPTIQGTENFLEVIKESPSVKKVVFIASVAAWNTNFPMPAGGKGFTDTFDETDTRFTSTEGHPYAQSKFIANQIVEKFIKEHTDLSFEITSVSPVMVMGSSLSDRKDSTSTGLQFLIKNKLAPDDFTQSLYDNDVPFAIVDVEDVAQAIFKVATIKGLHGKDYLLTSETYKVSDMHDMLNGLLPKSKAVIVYKNDLAVADLDIEFRPVKETLNKYFNL